MLDIEFTIEDGVLWMLQCRVGKRNGPAAVRMAVDMVKEKLIKKKKLSRALRRHSSMSCFTRLSTPAMKNSTNQSPRAYPQVRRRDRTNRFFRC